MPLSLSLPTGIDLTTAARASANSTAAASTPNMAGAWSAVRSDWGNVLTGTPSVIPSVYSPPTRTGASGTGATPSITGNNSTRSPHLPLPSGLNSDISQFLGGNGGSATVASATTTAPGDTAATKSSSALGARVAAPTGGGWIVGGAAAAVAVLGAAL